MTPGHGVTISEQVKVLELVGAEGYIHGYICVRPPCGPKPKAVAAAGLSVRGDGLVVHKASGWGIGQVSRASGGAWQAGHAADGSVTEHGAKVDAVRAVARKYNQAARSGAVAPAPKASPAARPAAAARVPRPRVPPPAAAPARAPAPGKELSGMDLWMSGEGQVKDVTPQEAQAAQAVWYSGTFSYTSNYMRHGTLPSVSSKNAIKAQIATGMGGADRARSQLGLPRAAGNDAEYIKDIGVLKGMTARAAPFSRPAVMYRDVTSPDAVFGPVGSMKGRVFSDPNFLSATATADSAERYGGTGQPDTTTGTVPVGDKIIMHIPAGGGGMRTQPQFSKDHAREKEFTFAPGTRWRVDDDQVVNGKRHTTVTQIVPPGILPGPKPAPVVPVIRPLEPWEGYRGGNVKVNVETGEYLS